MEEEVEIWKDIPNFIGLYQVSNLGRVKSLSKEWTSGKGVVRKHNSMILKQRKNKLGYYIIHLNKNGKRKYIGVHRLVLQAFVGISDLFCNHLDANTSNNKLENLEYCSHNENMQHAKKMGLICKGENHHDAKLTEEQVRKIKWIAKYTKRRYGYIKQTAKELGVSISVIRKIIDGNTWKHIEV